MRALFSSRRHTRFLTDSSRTHVKRDVNVLPSTQSTRVDSSPLPFAQTPPPSFLPSLGSDKGHQQTPPYPTSPVPRPLASTPHHNHLLQTPLTPPSDLALL